MGCGPSVKVIDESCVNIKGTLYYSEKLVQFNLNLGRDCDRKLNELHRKLAIKEAECKNLSRTTNNNRKIEIIDNDSVSIDNEVYYKNSYFKQLERKLDKFEKLLKEAERKNDESRATKSDQKTEKIFGDSVLIDNEIYHKYENVQLLQQKLDEAQKLNENLYETMLRKRKLFDHLQQENRSLKEDLDRKRGENDALQKKISSLEQENMKLHVDLREQRSSLETNFGEETTSNDAVEVTEQSPYLRNAFQRIDQIQNEMARIEGEVERFSGSINDKTFLHLKELLIRGVVDLDNIETEGYPAIRERRKVVIQFTHQVLDKLKVHSEERS